jgi:rhodanese-related sulfurtransferase
MEPGDGSCSNDLVSIPTVTVDNVPDPIPAGVNVLDVREDIEWTHGHIEGAVHIPLSQLPARIGDLPEGQTLIVCKIGGRSAQATMYLAAQGYEVANLDGGMLEWAGAGRPMVSETGQPPLVV